MRKALSRRFAAAVVDEEGPEAILRVFWLRFDGRFGVPHEPSSTRSLLACFHSRFAAALGLSRSTSRGRATVRLVGAVIPWMVGNFGNRGKPVAIKERESSEE